MRQIHSSLWVWGVRKAGAEVMSAKWAQLSAISIVIIRHSFIKANISVQVDPLPLLQSLLGGAVLAALVDPQEVPEDVTGAHFVDL